MAVNGTFTINNQSFEIKDGLTLIGRDPVACSIILPNVSISKTHAVIIKIENQFYISDLRSTNGTIVNEEVIIPHACQKILHNTKILLGDLPGTFIIEKNCFKVPSLPAFKSPKVSNIHEMDTQIMEELPMTQILPKNIHVMETQVSENNSGNNIHEMVTQLTYPNEKSNINEVETQLVDINEKPTIHELETQMLDGYETSTINETETQIVEYSEENVNEVETQYTDSPINKTRNLISSNPDVSNTSNSFLIPETQAETSYKKQISIQEIDESIFDSSLDITDTQMAKVDLTTESNKDKIDFEETQYDDLEGGNVFEEKTQMVESFDDLDILGSSQDNLTISKIVMKRKISENDPSAEISLQASISGDKEDSNIEIHDTPDVMTNDVSNISKEKLPAQCEVKPKSSSSVANFELHDSIDDDLFNIPTQSVTPNSNKIDTVKPSLCSSKSVTNEVLDDVFDMPTQRVSRGTPSSLKKSKTVNTSTSTSELFDAPTQVINNLPDDSIQNNKTEITTIALLEEDSFLAPTQKVELSTPLKPPNKPLQSPFHKNSTPKTLSNSEDLPPTQVVDIQDDVFEASTQVITPTNHSKSVSTSIQKVSTDASKSFDSEDLPPTQMVVLPDDDFDAPTQPITSNVIQNKFLTPLKKDSTPKPCKSSDQDDLFDAPTQQITTPIVQNTFITPLKKVSTPKPCKSSDPDDLPATQKVLISDDVFEAPTQQLTSPMVSKKKIKKFSTPKSLKPLEPDDLPPTQKVDIPDDFDEQLSSNISTHKASKRKSGSDDLPEKVDVPDETPLPVVSSKRSKVSRNQGTSSYQKVSSRKQETHTEETTIPHKRSTRKQVSTTKESKSSNQVDLPPVQKVEVAEGMFEAPTQKVTTDDVFMNETAVVNLDSIAAPDETAPKKSKRQVRKNPVVEEFLSSQRKELEGTRKKKDDKPVKKTSKSVKSSDSSKTAGKKEASATMSKESEQNQNQEDNENSTSKKQDKQNSTSKKSVKQNSTSKKSEQNQIQEDKQNSTSKRSELNQNQEENENVANVRKSSRKRHNEDNVIENPKERKIDTSLSLRTRYNVMFTLFRDDSQEAVVKKLGGRVVAKTQEANVLVTNEIRRSVKLLSAISQGIPVVSPNWLQVCKRENRFVDPWQHLLIDKNAEKKFGFELNDALGRAKEGLLLDGYTVVVTKSVPEDMKDIIENSGGLYLKKVPSGGLNEKGFIVSTLDDKSEWPRRKNKIPNIVSAEAIYMSVIRQRLDLKSHMFP